MATLTLQKFGEFNVETQEDLDLLKNIEAQVLDKMNLGFSPDIISILDNEDARQEDIEKIKLKLRQDVLSRLIGRANLVSQLGKAKGAEAQEFLNVVMRLGMKPAKVYILAFTLYFLSPELEGLAARGFSRAIIGKALARQLGLNAIDQDRVELGALLLEMGKIPLVLYEKQNSLKLSGDFISRYHPYLGVRMVQKFSLPDYLAGIVLNHHLTIDKNGFSATAVVDLAHGVVERSFNRAGKLVVQSREPGDRTESNLLSSITHAFQVIGLRKYLEIAGSSKPVRPSA
jgi:hypothetical protein